MLLVVDVGKGRGRGAWKRSKLMTAKAETHETKAVGHGTLKLMVMPLIIWQNPITILPRPMNRSAKMPKAAAWPTARRKNC